MSDAGRTALALKAARGLGPTGVARNGGALTRQRPAGLRTLRRLVGRVAR